MKRDEAEKEARRLNEEHPDRKTFRWVASSDGEGSWSVSRMQRIQRAGEAEGPSAASDATTATSSPDDRKVSRRARPAKETTARPIPQERPAQPPTRGLKGFVKRREVRLAATAAAVAALAWIVWELRMLVRPVYMLLLVRHPALVSVPLIAGGAAFLLHLLVNTGRRAVRRRAGAGGPGPTPTQKNPDRVRALWLRTRRALRGPLRGPTRSLLIFAAVGFVFGGLMTGSWTGSAIYQHTDYAKLDLADLRERNFRIKPYEVAKRQSANGLNSPTEHPTNLHIVKVHGRLIWTSVRDPDGLFRTLTKPTKGVMSVDAESSAPDVKQSGPRYDADFRYGPGMRISENVRWQVNKKKCFTCDVAEMTALPTRSGPIIVAPYIRYKGNWLVRRPTFGGVFVVHADGRIEDLSPEEAAARPLLRDSGRIYPEKLARRAADAYKFRNGVWNRLFLHSEQLDVGDTDENRQPYLQDFEGIGPQWVTTLKPHGRTFTTAGVIATDAVTGRSRIWLAPREKALIGNQKAIEIVRGETFPGIVFAQERDERTSRNYEVVEPRQIFRDGRLQFLLSIIPHAANRITKSVIVDADTQQVVAHFPASPEGDSDLIAYLRGSEPPPRADEDTAAAGEEPDPRAPEPPPVAGDTGAAATLRRLLRENRAEQRDARERTSALRAQERDLRRLLREIERTRGE